MHPSTMPSLVLFGPQISPAHSELLIHLRKALVTEKLFQPLLSAVQELQQTWTQIQVTDPQLSPIASDDAATQLVNWVENNVPPDLSLNTVATPVTVILHIVQYLQYISNLDLDADPYTAVVNSNWRCEGQCIGAIAALAIGHAKREADVLGLSATAVELAFLIGAYVDLDQHCSGDTCCSVVWWQDGTSNVRELEDTIRSVPGAYISVIHSSCHVTVTAPSTEIMTLESNLASIGLTTKRIALRGRFHNPVMEDSVEMILGIFKGREKPQLAPQHALRDAIKSILTEPEDWKAKLQDKLAQMDSRSDSHKSVLVIGPERIIGSALAKKITLQVTQPEFPLPTGRSFSDRAADMSTPETTGPLPSPQLDSYPECAVAIIGMACKFPGADSPSEFWDVIQSGKSLIQEVPEARFPHVRIKRRPGEAKFFAGLINDVDSFDHKFFKISSREAASMDPQQRLILQVAYQAMESAEYFSGRKTGDNNDIGCYLGVCTNEYVEHVGCHAPNAYSATGTLRSFICGKISHYFGWTGPSMTIDAACASSGMAIDAACQSIATGRCNTAVAGGVNTFNTPETFQNLAAGHFTSPTGGSKSFDAAADGYCRAEGVAMVVLKNLKSAIADGDNIMAVISSTSVSQNANAGNITIPNGVSQAGLYRRALKMSGLRPNQVSYVEAHGTGTPVGDPIEVESIRTVFGGSDRPNTLYMGSIKSSIGHTEGTSGIAGLMKVVLMLQHQTIPSQALFYALNPKIPPLEPHQMIIPTTRVSWDLPFRAACVNCYGASGSNAVMIVTQPPSCVLPKLALTEPALRPAVYPIKISAASLTSLAQYCKVLDQYVEKVLKTGPSEDSELSSLSFTLSRKFNPALSYYHSTMVSNLDELRRALAIWADGSSLPQQTVSRISPAVLVFGGQTSNRVDSPDILYQSSTLFRKYLDECDSAVCRQGLGSIFPCIFSNHPIQDVVSLHTMLFSQQYACAKTWLESGLHVDVLIGHSFGQLTALCVSGTLSLDDGVKLIAGRAHLLKSHWGTDPGSMIVIEGGHDVVQDVLALAGRSDCEIACYNAAESHVVAGSTASIQALQNHLSSTKQPSALRNKRLEVTNAFHSKLTEPLLSSLKELAKELDFRTPEIPLENCSEWGITTNTTPELIVRHTREPVFFHQAVQRIAARFGPCVWLEAGTGGGMSHMVKRALGTEASSHHVQSLSLRSSNPFDALLQVSANLWKLGHQVCFWPFHPSQRAQYTKLDIPPYQFDKSRHWLEWKEIGPSHNPQQISPPTLVSLDYETQAHAKFTVNQKCGTYKELNEGNIILGLPFCPQSSQLEFVEKAAWLLDNVTSAAFFDDIIFHELLPYENDRSITVTLERLDVPFSYKFSVDSKAKNDVESTRHTSGIISLGSKNHLKIDEELSRYQRLLSPKHIKALFEDMDAESLRGKSVYRTQTDSIQIGRDRQRIKLISAKNNDVVALVEIPVPGRSEDSVTDQLAIDNFIQVPSLHLSCLRGFQKELYLPIEVQTIRTASYVTGPSSKGASWVVYANLTDQQKGDITSDIYALDSKSYRLHMIILGVRFRRLDHAALHDRPFDENGYHEKDAPFKGESKKQTIEHDATKTISESLPLAQNQQIHGGSPELPSLEDALHELLSKVADVDTGDISNEILLADLGIDSLMGMEVLADINKQFSLNMSLHDFDMVSDVESLYKILSTRVKGYSVRDIRHDGNCKKEVAGGDIQETSRQADLPDYSRSVSSLRPPVNNGIHSPDRDQAEVSCLLAVARDAFLSIRNDFHIYAKETKCDTFWTTTYPLQAELVTAYIVEAFLKLGTDIASMEPHEALSRVPHNPRHTPLVNQLMKILEDSGHITRGTSENTWMRTTKKIPHKPSTELLGELQTRFPAHATEHELLHVTASKLAECLTGSLDPLSLLFGDRKQRQLLQDVYANGPMQQAATRLLASFLRRFLSADALKSTRSEPFHILELGGGTGGTSQHIIEVLAGLSIPITYTFTDISSSLVKAAKQKLNSHSFLTFETLDIEREPPLDYNGKFHMVFATNVLHATADLSASIANAKRILRADGFLTLIEFTKNIYWFDLVFGLLEGWWAHSDGRKHAFLDEELWRQRLGNAGFGSVNWTGGSSDESNTLRILMAS